MSTSRLRARVASASPKGVAFLPSHSLRFHKRSRDGSGKADAYFAGVRDIVHGVLFELSDDDLLELDRIEGNGYERLPLEVRGQRAQVAFVYRATRSAIEPGLFPTCEYLAHILAGAIEHHLPPEYISALRLTITLD